MSRRPSPATPAAPSALRGLRASFDAWAEVRQVISISRWRVLGYGALGGVIGATEAMFLALLATAGVALASDDTGRVALPFAGATDLPINAVLGLGTGLALLTLAAQFLLQRGLARISAHVVSQLRQDGYALFVATGWEIQAEEGESDFLALLVSHIPRLANVVVALVNQLNGMVTMAVFVAIAVAFSPVVAGAVVMAGSVLMVLFLPLQALTRRAGKETAVATGELFAGFGDALASGRDVKSYGVDDVMHAKLRREIERVERPTYRARLLQGIVPVVYQRVVLLLVLLALALAAVLDVGELGPIGAALLVLLRALQKGQLVQAAQIQVAEILPWVSEVVEKFRHYRSNRDVVGSAHLDTVDEVELDNVSYVYETGEVALQNVSIRLKRGELIGLIGPSGSGKTTLSEILVRLRRPTSGSYRVNGRDAWEYDRDSWCAAVAMVPQFARTLATTIAENIRFLRDRIDDAEVVEAAEAAHLRSEIEVMDRSYETVVAERGERGLSGGQKQRLAIARALVGHPSLVVLDEPTSALDHEAERAIVDTIEALSHRACVVVIAHRMSTLRQCDRVLVLTDGRVEAFCAVDELAERSDFFRAARQLPEF